MTMDDVFASIMFYEDQSNKTRIYSELEYEWQSTIWVSKVTQKQDIPQYQQKGQSYTWKDGYQKQNDSKHLCFLRNQQQVDRQQQGKTNLYEYCKNNKEMGSIKCYHCEASTLSPSVKNIKKKETGTRKNMKISKKGW